MQLALRDSQRRVHSAAEVFSTLPADAGRRQLQTALERLKKIQSTTPSTVIERCAAHAIRQVTFKTRPYEELPAPEM